VALPHDLQLRRCLPAWDQHHPGDPRGLLGDRGASDLNRSLWGAGELDRPAEGGGAGEEPPHPAGRDSTPSRASDDRTLRLIVRTDGAARSNPGPASAGAVLIDADSSGAREPLARPIATISDYLGNQTNNVAEYTACIRALGLARELGAREVHLLLDSKLIVEQVHGRWKVKDAKLQPLHAEARRLLAGFVRWTAVHVPRAENKAADALCNEAIDRALAGGPASVVRRLDGSLARPG
jgi:ribonuclease HI